MSENPGIFDLDEAEEYLSATGHLDRALEKFCPAKHNDYYTVRRTWLINCANMVKWNNGNWGPDYIVGNCRGQSLDMPGAFQSRWDPTQTFAMVVREWP